jgi:hypothetical protein
MEWISIQDRKPEASIEALVFIKEKGEVILCKFSLMWGSFKANDNTLIWGVTHWIPLPILPSD